MKNGWMMAGSVLIAICFWVGVAGADIMIQQIEYGDKEITYYQGKKIATVSDDLIQIVDAGAKTIIGADPKSKTYYEATLDQYKKAMIDVMRQAKDMQIQMMMASTGQTREQAEASLKKADRAKTIIIEKGATRDITGYASDEYRIVANGKTLQEIWVSPALDAMIAKSIGAAEKKELDKMIHDIETEINGIINLSGQDAEIAEAESEIMKKGYVMKQIDREMGMPGTPAGDSGITVSTKPVEPSIFSVPSGYKKITMAEYLQATMMGDGEDEE